MRQRVDFDLSRAQELLEQGMSLRATAEALGISDRTLRRRLGEGDQVRVNGDVDLDEEGLLLKSIAELQGRLREQRQRVLSEWQAFDLDAFNRLQPSDAIKSSFEDSVLNLRRRHFDRVQISPALDTALNEYDSFELRVIQLATNLQASRKALDQPTDAHFSSILRSVLTMLKPLAEQILQSLLQAANSEELLCAREIAAKFSEEFENFASDPLSGIWCEISRGESVLAGAGQTRPWRRELAIAFLMRGRLDDPLTCLRLLEEHDNQVMAACRVVLPDFEAFERRFRATRNFREFLQDIKVEHLLRPLIELLQ